MTMLRMFRVRGKRVWYLAFAAFTTFLIFRWSTETEQGPRFGGIRTSNEQLWSKPVAKGNTELEKVEEALQDTPERIEDGRTEIPQIVKTLADLAAETPVPNPPTIPTVPPYRPSKKPPSDVNGIPESDEFLRPSKQEGRLEAPVVSATTTIHWISQVEHFPVKTESIIQLPTGAPLKIPKIQFNFKDETSDSKISREKRQTKVKAEFQKAWKGYSEKAWLHDEVSPVSGSYRDPFCGWAATLVDGLDTLWIMGFETEFERAVKAIGQMDFTTSHRHDIPMFETTIRYLGGLIAAYDISGNKYKVLLAKAVELADVMMGAFDTPNRMPYLYYQWQPAYASQAKRASSSANTAELGSLSMEFTRLAQITKEPRYYDAVARVTNALSDWQDRGTPLDGVFPDNIDASGCNRTEVSLPVGLPKLANPVNSNAQPHGYQPLEAQRDVGTPKGAATEDINEPDLVGLKILPGNPSKATFVRDDEDVAKVVSISKRALDEDESTSRTDAAVEPNINLGPPIKAPSYLHLDTTSYASNAASDWDCVPQGLEPAYPAGTNRFSMGGGQDSTYEYFSKQYLLLGGQEQKYGKMYLKTIEAVRKYMLYRPMVPGNKDILFSGKVEIRGSSGVVSPIEPEVEHLTCFIGGMVGMGAKIFDIEDDLEIAKKLTDGCVWAYESFPSGIMPEGSTVAACKDLENCEWDEKAYHLILDPMGESRDKEVDDYLALKAAAVVANEEAAKEAFEAAQRTADGDNNGTTVADDLKLVESPIGSAKLEKEEPVSLQKRGLEDDLASLQKKVPSAGKPAQVFEDLPEKSDPRPNMDAKTSSTKPTGSDGSSAGAAAGVDNTKEEPLAAQGDDFSIEEVELGREAGVSPKNKATKDDDTIVDPILPFTHKEWVESRIAREGLPPGFTSIRAKNYILRPEAIESVWYMYRITGDPVWQEKGWRMFEAIIAATSTNYGHSAVYDVTTPKPLKIDEMESFWLAETLKYFYLLFSTPDVVSLDEWVLNTEAHPFRRPTAA